MPITKYETPGGQKFADTMLPFVKKSNVIILANHGTVSFGETVERAYWWTEILDAYCRILMLSRDLGKVTYFTEQKTRELLDLKKKWGFTDPRLDAGNEELRHLRQRRVPRQLAGAGIERRAFEPPPPMGPERGRGAAKARVQQMPNMHVSATATGTGRGDADQEALIRAITERVMAALAQTAK